MLIFDYKYQTVINSFFLGQGLIVIDFKADIPLQWAHEMDSEQFFQNKACFIVYCCF